MTDSLTDSVLSQVQGAGLGSIASQLGTDEQTAGQAVAAAVPMLLGALGHNAQQPGGAEALLGALQRDHAGQGAVDFGSLLGGLAGGAGAGGAGAGGLASMLGGILGGGGASASRQLDGAGILGHILGANQGNATTGLSRLTGLDGGQSGKLLQLLAPIVMGLLARRATAGKLDAGGLGSLLGQKRAQAQQQGGGVGDLLGMVLGQGGGGDVGGMLGQLAGSLLRGGR